jgi:hypothetical protein
MTPDAIMNLISRDKFPVPTSKLGKKRMIDLAVLRTFFEAKKAEGLSRLVKSINGHKPTQEFATKVANFVRRPDCWI